MQMNTSPPRCQQQLTGRMRYRLRVCVCVARPNIDRDALETRSIIVFSLTDAIDHHGRFQCLFGETMGFEFSCFSCPGVVFSLSLSRR